MPRFPSVNSHEDYGILQKPAAEEALRNICLVSRKLLDAYP